MTEIEKLRKELNDRLDAFENKPKHEVGKWNWTKMGSLYFIEKIDENRCYGYGLGYNNEWIKGSVCYTKAIKRIATDAEVTETLTKEAIKRGLVEGAKYNPVFNITNSGEVGTVNKEYVYDNTITNGFYNGFQYLMLKGIWATVIKERSLKEWYDDYLNNAKIGIGIRDYIKSTKNELIEILKNLPND
ncbi:hypothetical protein [uncultured Clostridium sp.]|uniref:hypothetical protein n=1 Tax=uncultured Clostridium sp. TaxID=59620 RepID=UPI002627D28A|nr:hypothetical protein [uncultured Clostridium sp.]